MKTNTIPSGGDGLRTPREPTLRTNSATAGMRLKEDNRPVRMPRTAAAGLIAGPLIMATAEIIHPALAGSDSATLAAQVAGHHSAWLWWAAGLFLGSLVGLPGLLGVLSAVAGRGRLLTRIGIGLATVGVVGAAGFAVMNSQLAFMAGPGGLDPAVAAALVRAQNDPTSTLCLLFFFVGMHVGWPLWVGGASRAGLAHNWQWVAAAIASLCILILSQLSAAFEVGGMLLIVAAVLPTAFRLWKLSSPASVGSI